MDGTMDLTAFASVSRWQLPVFKGKLHIEGRILSVSEAETAGLASGLILATLATPEHLLKVKNASEEDQQAHLLKMAKSIQPHQIAKLNESNDKIICQVIKRASMDDGESWENIQVVTAEEQQDPNENKLWVGVFSEVDRDAILKKALEGHKEAADRIASFRK